MIRVNVEDSKLKIATINLPDDVVDLIEKLVCEGEFPSRSECVRKALGMFLEKEQRNEKIIQTFLQNPVPINPIISVTPTPIEVKTKK